VIARRSNLDIEDISIFEIPDENDLEENELEYMLPDLSLWIAKRTLRDAIMRLDVAAFKIIGSSESQASIATDELFDDVTCALLQVQSLLAEKPQTQLY
jgi:hypothetical protein